MPPRREERRLPVGAELVPGGAGLRYRFRLDGGDYLYPEDLLALRRDDAVFRLLLVNLGRALQLAPLPEPLLAPPDRRAWQLLWALVLAARATTEEP